MLLFKNGKTDSAHSALNTGKALNTQKIVHIKIILESLPKYYLILGIRTLVKRLLVLRIHLLHFIVKNFFPFFLYFTTKIVTLAISLLSVVVGLIIFSKVVQLKNKLSLHGTQVLN